MTEYWFDKKPWAYNNRFQKTETGEIVLKPEEENERTCVEFPKNCRTSSDFGPIHVALLGFGFQKYFIKINIIK